MTTGDIIIVLAMLAVSAFFSGVEMAFVSASKLKIELKSKQGSSTGRILSDFIKHTPRVITTILVGNNIALVMFGISMGHIITYLLYHSFGIDAEVERTKVLLLQTAISTLVILIFGEYLPKAIFRINPDNSLSFSARILQIFYYGLAPLVVLINLLTKFILKTVLRLKYEEEEVTFGKRDLYMFMQETLAETEGGTAPEIDAEMFSNAMELNETRVREFMVPRTEIEALPLDSTVDQLIDKLVETELSRIIIYQESLDNVLGFVHSSMLFKHPKTVADALQPILMVPESMSANVLLKEFTKHRRSIAIVVDEFGGTEGLVTMEDLVEEVFGEIDDEHDEPEEDELLAKQVDPNTWILSTRWEVYDVNKEFELDLPEGDYNTLSGLIMFHAEDIPGEGDTIVIGDYTFTVMEAAQNKVETVKMHRKPMV